MSDTSNISPINGKTPELNAYMPIRHAACTAFNYFYRNMKWNEKGTLLERDPEFLHYFRVSSKRLRVALSVFRPYFGQNKINYFKDELKTLAPVLGSPRDLDVYLEFLSEDILPEMTAVERKSLKKYLGFFKEYRKHLQNPIINQINSKRYLVFKKRFEEFLKKGLSGCTQSTSSGIGNFAKLKIRQEGKILLKMAKRLLRHSSDKRLHKFRIECRKMRYRTELFLSLLGSDGKKLSKKLVELQNALGGWHDSITAGEKLEDFIKARPNFKKSHALRKLRKIQKRRAGRFKEKFFRKLKGIKKIGKLL